MPISGHPFSWQIKKPRYGSRGLAVKNHCVAALGEVGLSCPLPLHFDSSLREGDGALTLAQNSAATVRRDDAFPALRPQRCQVRIP